MLLVYFFFKRVSMLVYVQDITNKTHTIEVEPNLTILDLYELIWRTCGYESCYKSAGTGLHDGLALCFAGKRLRHESYAEVAKENGYSVEIFETYGYDKSIVSTLSWYNIQRMSTIYVIFYETNARKQLNEAIKNDCCICLESLSDVANVGMRECKNGHIIHWKCGESLQECPMCRSVQWYI